MQDNWQKINIGTLIKRKKDSIFIDDKKIYKRLTIKMHNKGICVRDEILGSQIGTKNQFMVKTGWLLLSKIDARNGAFGIIPEETNGGIITGNFWAYELDLTKVDPQFFFYFSHSERFLEFCIASSQGATNRRYLQEGLFLNKEILLPTLIEQKRIVKKLKEIENRTKFIIKTEDYIGKAVDNIMPSALSKIFSDINWKKDKIGNLIDDIKTGMTPPSGESKYFKEEVSWFTPSDFQGQMYLESSSRKVSNLAISDGKVKMYNSGALLFIGIGATLGKVGILKKEASSNQQITAIQFKKKILPEFAYYWFKTNYSAIRRLCPATTLPILNQEKIKNLDFLFPSTIKEQQKIIDHLNLIETKKQQISDEQKQQTMIVNAFMPSVLSKAFAGEL